MSRKRTLLALFGLAALTVIALLTMLLVDSYTLHAAPSGMPATIEPDQYFPLGVGNQWVYSWTNDVYAPSPIIENIVITEQVSSLYKMRAYHIGAEGEFRIITTTGYQWDLWYSSHGSDPFPLPMYLIPYYLRVPTNLLPASFQVEDTWTGTGQYGGTAYTGTTTVVTNTATVSASGRIYTNCLQLHTVINGPHPFGAGTRDAWFAPDVGLVKLVYNHNDGSVTRAELLMGPHIHAVYIPLISRNFETVPPVVLSTYPPHGATGVGRDLIAVSITFNEPMQYRWSLSSSGGFPLSAETQVSYNPVNYTFTFMRTTTDPLPASTLITFTINPQGYEPGFVDLCGNPAPTTMFSFTTGD